MFKQVKIWWIKNFGGVLWTRRGDKGEVLVKTFGGEITQKSPFAYTHSYVLTGWEKLGAPFQLRTYLQHTCLLTTPALDYIILVNPSHDLPKNVIPVDLFKPFIKEIDWRTAYFWDIKQLYLAVQDATQKMKRFLDQ
jgi:hypothetical protein